LINVESLDDARVTFNSLPFVSQRQHTHELVPVAPLAPLGRPIQDM
jgi:hypothetical protein